MGSIYLHVAGESFDNRDGSSRQNIIESHCKAGMPVCFVQEPDNQYDEFAVGVWITTPGFLGFGTKQRQIGYVNRQWSERICNAIDDGHRLSGTISEIMGGTRDKPSLGVVLAVESDADLWGGAD